MAKLTYKDAGVDREKGYEEVELIKNIVKKTQGQEVIAGVGGFAAAFAPDLKDIKDPVLISGTDGIGTKLKLAVEMDKHDTVGIDCVAMCVNDIICQGADPLFFLDYIATSKLQPKKMTAIVSGIAAGCQEAGAALIGGETSEMPDLYKEGDYDLAGFAVGIADRDKMITGDKLKDGDLVLGLKSSGVHSNGFTLVRASLKQANISLTDKFDDNKTIGEKLLTPTKIYAKDIKKLREKIEVKGLAHITGGGLYENIPRVLKKGLAVELDLREVKIDPIFKMIQSWGNIETNEMYHTFNMGVGMVVFIDPADKNVAFDILGDESITIGKVVKGDETVNIKF